ncbi:hypothetical protein XPA_001690 [Xanthoria parietina]
MAVPPSAADSSPSSPVHPHPTDNTFANGSQDEKQPMPTRASLLTRLWQKSGLNIGMLAIMFKGALAPTIAIALYQSTAFADHYSTLGYLVAIMSILSFGIMPRAKFVQTMLFNIIGICIGFCITLLSIFCSVQARAHTTPPLSTGPKSSTGGPSPGASVAPYNSPQLQFPVIMYSIFANVASTYAPQFATMAQGIAFGRRLFEAFLTGFAIAIAVSFFVFPLTSRMVVLRTTTGYIKALSSALKAQSAYLQSLEDRNAFGQLPRWEDEAHRGRETEKSPTVGVITELHGKISGDLAFAKREIAYGKLDASELSEILKLMRQVMLPIIGMSSVADIFSRVAERQGWWIHEDDAPEHLGRSDEVKEMEMEQWSEIMRTLHQPFEVLTCWMNQGLQHVLFTLELEENSVKQRNKTAHTSNDNSPDLEASVNDMRTW